MAELCDPNVPVDKSVDGDAKFFLQGGDNMSNKEHAFDMFRTMSEAVAGELGEAFIERLVTSLSVTLHAEFVAVTRGEGDPVTYARALCAWKGGAVTEHGSFATKGRPCTRVFAGEEVVIPCDLESFYPSEKGMESCLGLPLWGIDGRVCGHIVVLSQTKLTDSTLALSILKVFAARAESELRRLVFEEERQKLIQALEHQAERLQTSWAAAHEANAFKTNLLGLIAHDLRSPLAAISAQAELADMHAVGHDDLPPGIGRAVSKIHKNVDRMSDQIEATLARVRAESTALKPKFSAGDIVEIARSALEANRPAAKAKTIALEMQSPASLPAECDEGLLFPAIDNLLTNAIKYTHPGGSALLSVETLPNGSVEIAVNDSGQGLSPDDLIRAFQPFEALSAKPTANEASTGLGLANVKAVAEAHGGFATVTSAGKDLGARFAITLPVQAVDPCVAVSEKARLKVLSS